MTDELKPCPPVERLRPQFCLEPNPHGDCWRACLATITGLDAATMPNFMHLGGEDRTGDTGVAFAREWLRPYGLTVFSTFLPNWRLLLVLQDASAINPGAAFILTGRAKGVEDHHSVVALDGAIVHDPSGVGLSGPMQCQCGKPGCDLKHWSIDLVVPLMEERP